jgi:hypothetical protein
MSTAIAARMTAADFLKLRKKRGTVIVAALLALLPIVIFFAVRAPQHSSNPLKYGPAGGVEGFSDGMRIVAIFLGPLAAILIGVEGGAADVASGVFRDLVVTGRSRLALFATRVPAALALTWLVTIAAYALLLLGTFVFADNAPTPSGALIANGLGFALLSTGVMCVVAVGLAALLASRPAALTVLIGWTLIVEPVLANISSLGEPRKALLSQAVVHFTPVHVGDRGASITMSQGTALVVMAAWVLAFLALGAWRTRTMDT